jgi:hypothetical protein
MSSTLTGVYGTPLLSFRNFAREIRTPQPYQLVVSECKGLLNIIIGLGQILVCPYFKLFKAERLYIVHLEAGKAALKEAARDLSPVIAITAVVVAILAAKQPT